jgi:hypothetical protein
MIALAGLGLLWFAYGLHSLVTWIQAPDESPTFRLVVPFVLAGLHVVAGYGLVAGGSWGRVLAVLVALAGAVPVIAVSFILVLWAATDPHGTTFSLTSEGAYGLPTWFFIVLVVTVIAGYGLVLVRAVRGR